jgi:hypothetical protein
MEERSPKTAPWRAAAWPLDIHAAYADSAQASHPKDQANHLCPASKQFPLDSSVIPVHPP